MRRFLQLALLLCLGAQAFAQVYSNLDDNPSVWQIPPCIGVKCAGGVANPTSTNQSFNNPSPSIDGGSFFMTESGTNYYNTTWPLSLGANNADTYFYSQFWINIPLTTQTSAQSVGPDMFFRSGGTLFMFGSECSFAGALAPYWQINNPAGNHGQGAWVQTSHPCTLSDGGWHFMQFQGHRVPGDISCPGNTPALYYDFIIIDGTNIGALPSQCSSTTGYNDNRGWQLDLNGNSGTGTVSVNVDQLTYIASIGPLSISTPYNAITTTIVPDVLAAPSLGGLTSNNALVTDAMIAGNAIYRVTDGNTQTGANANFEYSVPCGGSADNNIISLADHFFLTVDSGSNYFIRYLNTAGNNSLPLYPNLDPAKGNLIVNCGEFSYTNDLLYYDHDSGSTAVITQYNLAGYNSPGITNPATLPTQTQIANFGNAGITGVQWRTLGGMNRSDNVNGLSFVVADGFSLTGGQDTGCIAAAAVANAENPVATNNLYYVYNTCTGVVTEYSYSGSWNPTTLGTISNSDRYCVHNVKYHGGPYVTVTANRGGSCSSPVTGTGSAYYFWSYQTSTVIPCVACTGHETEYINSFIGADDADNDGSNFQQIAYATTGAGLVNTSGTTMTFVSGIPPNASMTGKIAINNVGYGVSSCNSTSCTLTSSAGTQSGVYYNWPVTGAQGGGSYGAPQLINYPSLWDFPNCAGGSFPYTNQPCLETPLDTHLNSNSNPGNDTGMAFYSSTSYGNTGFPRSAGFVSVASGTVTLNYGALFSSLWVGHNIIINGTNCRIATDVSTSQITVTACSLGTLTNASYFFTLYPGGGYDEVQGVVGGGSTPAPGYNYRLGYEYNSTLNPYFSTYNGITSCSQDGTICLISTDWQCTLGTTNGTTTSYCPPDWYASGSLFSGALLKPTLNNAGGYAYSTLGACTLGGTTLNPWPQTVGSSQANGSCTLTNIGALRGDVIAMNTGAIPASTQTLTVVVAGSGTVTDNLSEISCPSTCSASYTTGTTVSLTATPTSGYSFVGWSGACSGAGACSVVMSSSQAATATFTAITLPAGAILQNATAQGALVR